MRLKNALLIFFSLLLLAGCGKTAEPAIVTPEPTDLPTPTPTASAGYTLLPGAERSGTFDVTASDGVIDLSDFGMKITLPEAVQDLPIAVSGYVQGDRAVANLCLADENDPNNRDCVFGEVFAYPGQQALEALIDSAPGMTEEMIHELGTNETLNYYVLRLDELRQNSPEYFEEIMGNLSEEQRAKYEALLEALPEVIGGMELTAMTIPGEPKAADLDSENLMDYTMPDLDGKATRLGDLILDNRVTMLNVWGIGCGPCMTEMPYLKALRDRYGGEGFEIVGLAADLLDPSGEIDPELVEEAKEITEELGVEYPVLTMTKEIRTFMKITATPTTYFVSSTGQVIGEAVMGARDEGEWERLIQNALANG